MSTSRARERREPQQTRATTTTTTATTEEQAQSSQPTRSASIMDPSQNMAERRKIRRNYRELIQKTTDVRQEYIRPESDGLNKALEQGDELYQEVKNPREAALDSEFLSLTSQYGLEQTKRIQTGFKDYEIGDFITRIRTLLQGADATQANDLATQDLSADSYDWNALGKKYESSFNVTPSANFMYGPLSIEAKQKAVRKKVVREKRGELVRPEEVLDTQAEGEVETTRRVQDLEDQLRKVKHVDYCKFVMNPKSFGQTVENIFHSAFLVKDGRARLLEVDKTPILEPAPPPTEQDYESGKAIRKHFAEQFIQQLREKNPLGIIPHRTPGTYQHPGLQKPQDSQTSKSAQPNGKKTASRNEEEEEEEESGESEGTTRKRKVSNRKSNNHSNNNNNNNNKQKRLRKNTQHVSDSEEDAAATRRKEKGKARIYDKNTDYTEETEDGTANESMGSPDVEGDGFVADSQPSQDVREYYNDARAGYDEPPLNDGRRRRR